MLGQDISDPHEMEHAGSVPGFGLLAIHTSMQPEKTTRLASGSFAGEALFGQPIGDLRLSGYEIHIGETRYGEGAKPFANLVAHSDSTISNHLDGCISADGRTLGTYLHGLFDDDCFRHAFLASARAFHELAPAAIFDNYKQKREQALNRLADAVRASLDMRTIFAWAGIAYQPVPAREDGL